MLFKAYFSFRTETTESFREEQSSIQFEADSQAEAVKDFVRWWNNRHTAVPSYFQTIFAVKVQQIIPQRVGEDGYLPSDVAAFGHFEWKFDWPGAAEIWQKLEELADS